MPAAERRYEEVTMSAREIRKSAIGSLLSFAVACALVSLMFPEIVLILLCAGPPAALVFLFLIATEGEYPSTMGGGAKRLLASAIPLMFAGIALFGLWCALAELMGNDVGLSISAWVFGSLAVIGAGAWFTYLRRISSLSGTGIRSRGVPLAGGFCLFVAISSGLISWIQSGSGGLSGFGAFIGLLIAIPGVYWAVTVLLISRPFAAR
jgi:hypothetical protein